MTTETVDYDDDGMLDDLALEALAEAYAEPAPPSLRGRLLAAVASERERHVAARRVRRAWLVGAVAAAVAFVLAGVLARALRESDAREGEIVALTEQNRLLSARIDEQGRTLAGLRETLDAQTQVLRLVGGPRVLSASLAPQGEGAATGRVLLDAASGNAALVLSGLSPAPPGKTYELWAIRGKKPPEPAGLVTVDAERGAAFSIPTLDAPKQVTAFAVSIEPRGGSSAPTGPIVLAGSVAG